MLKFLDIFSLAVYFIKYGCQMNANDVEIVRALMFSNGYAETDALSEVCSEDLCYCLIMLLKTPHSAQA